MAEKNERVSEASETTKATKDKPQAKKAKAKKNGKVGAFFKDLKGETKKITWYSKKDTAKSSALVIAVVVICTVVLGLLDWGFGSLIALLGNLV